MNLEDYSDFVTGLMSPASMVSAESKLTVAGLGLGGEGGECADVAKKALFHGTGFDEAARQKMIKELGDVMFYVTFAARHVCGITVQEVIDANVEKLQDRYKTGKFSVAEFKAKEAAKEKPWWGSDGTCELKDVPLYNGKEPRELKDYDIYNENKYPAAEKKEKDLSKMNEVAAAIAQLEQHNLNMMAGSMVGE